MTSPAPVVQQPGFPARIRTFYQDVVAEMRKVTWPDVPQVRQLSVGVVLLSLFIAFVIFLMDKVFQVVLVQWLPRLFS